jgi:hypothetical protein
LLSPNPVDIDPYDASPEPAALGHGGTVQRSGGS